MIPSQDEVKAEIIRRLDSGEITKDQARQAAEKYKAMASKESQPAALDVPSAPQYQSVNAPVSQEEAPFVPNALGGPVQEQAPYPEMVGDVPSLPRDLLMGYKTRGLTYDQRMQVEDALKTGKFAIPEGEKLNLATDQDVSGIGEMISGSERGKGRAGTLDSYLNMPEFTTGSIGGLGQALASTTMGTKEKLDAIHSNFPYVKISKDFYGTPILTSPINGKSYAIPFGFGISDAIGTGLGVAAGALAAPAIVAGTAAMGGGALAGIGATALGEAGAQALVEAGQYAGGGDVDPLAILAAGGTAGVMQGGGELVKRGSKGLKEAFGSGQDAVKSSQVDVDTTITPKESEDLGGLLKKAQGGSKKAGAQVGEILKENPQARRAADLANVEVPMDVLSDDYRASAMAGIARKTQGGDADVAWKQNMTETTEAFDKHLKGMGALYSSADDTLPNGGPSLPDVAKKIKVNLEGAKADLEKKARILYDEENALPKKTLADTSNLVATLREVREETGDAFTDAEKKLLDRAENGTITMGGILREKAKVRKSLKGTNAYESELSEEVLNRIKKALDDDQIGTVRKISGDDSADKLIAANAMWAKKSKLDEQLVKAFGKDSEGSIGKKLTSVFKNIESDPDFERIMKIVPNELIPEVLATGMAKASRSTNAQSLTKGQFGFSEFDDFMSQLNLNSDRKAFFVEHLGSDKMGLMNAMHILSKRMTKARSLGPRGTGADLLPAIEKIQAENFVSKVLQSPMIRGALNIAPGGKAVGAGLGALGGLLSTGGDKALKDISAFLVSPELTRFIRSATKASEMQLEKEAKRLSITAPFRKFAKAAKLPTERKALESWITSALSRESAKE